jgi:hypothetical protein
VKEKEEADHYWKVVDYRYPKTPSELCDELLKKSDQHLTISFLESLPENTKRAFADLLIHTVDFKTLKEKF